MREGSNRRLRVQFVRKVAANAIKVGLRVDAGGGRVRDLQNCDSKSVPKRSQLFERFDGFNGRRRQVPVGPQKPDPIGVQADMAGYGASNARPEYAIE